MLIEEAVELIKNELECVNRNVEKNCDRMCSDCDLVRGVAEIRQAYQMAIEALEKQILMDPIELGYEIFYCPSCGNCISIHAPYCNSCGQLLDWE